MKTPVDRLYRWHEELKEPYKFILMFVPAMILIMCAHSSITPLSIIGIILFIFFFATAFIYHLGEWAVECWNELEEQVRVTMKQTKG